MSSPCAAADEPPSYRGYRYPVEIISHAVWLRRVRLWSQADLAREAGVATSTVSHIETGKAPNLRPSVIRKLARVLGVKDPLTVREFRDAILQGDIQPGTRGQDRQSGPPN